MVGTINLKRFQIVPKEMIEWCANQFGPEEENVFSEFLDVAEIYSEAGLTPVFLCTDTIKDLHITTKEKLQKNYH